MYTKKIENIINLIETNLGNYNYLDINTNFTLNSIDLKNENLENNFQIYLDENLFYIYFNKVSLLSLEIDTITKINIDNDTKNNIITIEIFVNQNSLTIQLC